LGSESNFSTVRLVAFRVVTDLPLTAVRVLNLGVNLPAAAAAARLAQLGATVTKVEPPGGDPVQDASADYYDHLTDGQTIVRIDLKRDRGQLDELLGTTDVLLTASRPTALARLGLEWHVLTATFPRLVHVALVGHATPRQDIPGHDLTYLARSGLLSPPALPRTLIADLGGAERVVSTSLALLLARERTGTGACREVALEESAEVFSRPWRHGLTRPTGILGGGSAGYGLYLARGGWIALAALEPAFEARLVEALGVESATHATLSEAFARKTPEHWESWAQQHDLPLAAVE
jgi:alpha-methylacyl-CoA racemase